MRWLEGNVSVRIAESTRLARATEARTGLRRGKPNQPRIKHGSLTVLYSLAIAWIPKHGHEGRNRRVFGDETFVPFLVTWPY